MQRLITCLLVVLASTSSIAQRIDTASISRLSPELRAEVNAHLTAAKKARTTGLIMAAGGGAVGIVGLAIVFVQISKGYLGLATLGTDPDLKFNESAANTGLVLFVAGAGTALGSIFLFKKTHRLRNAARAIVFADRGVSLQPNLILPHTQTVGLRLAIDLGE